MPTVMSLDLRTYDYVLVQSSAGKDSQTTLHVVCERARAQGVLDRVVVLHCDLGEMEWPGVKDLAAQQAACYGVRFETVRRRTKSGQEQSLLEHIRARGKFPSSTTRYCTSDHKRGPAATLFTRLVNEWRETRAEPGRDRRLGVYRQCRILTCLGMRAQESSGRAKLVPFERDETNTNGKRLVDRWLPIHHWTVDEVWETIRASGVPHHSAYDLGMPRLSCRFCIFSPRSALLLAGEHNRALLDQYVAVEQEIGHTFKKDLSLASIRDALDRGERATKVSDWSM